MRVPTWSLLCALLVARLPHGQAVTSIVLQPTKTGTTEAALIVVPGAAISGDAYRPLGMAHVYTMRGKYSAGLSGSADGLPSQQTQPPTATGCHQLCPRHASPTGYDVQQQLRRWSQLGRDMPLAAYPFPVLTISGVLERQTRITRIADKFEQLQAIAATNRSHVYGNPVIVMRGVNHAQFASGAMPKEVVTRDLTPEVTSQAAYTLIAKHTSAFLVATLHAPQTAHAKACADLDAAYVDTLKITKAKWG